MKKIIFLIIVYPLFVTSNLCAQNLSKNEVFDVLSKWEGKWKTSVVFEESIWVSKGYETRGITNSKLHWILSFCRFTFCYVPNILKLL